MRYRYPFSVWILLVPPLWPIAVLGVLIWLFQFWWFWLLFHGVLAALAFHFATTESTTHAEYLATTRGGELIEIVYVSLFVVTFAIHLVVYVWTKIATSRRANRARAGYGAVARR